MLNLKRRIALLAWVLGALLVAAVPATVLAGNADDALGTGATTLAAHAPMPHHYEAGSHAFGPGCGGG